MFRRMSPQTHTREKEGSKVMSMNPKVKARWVKALRSGRYKQGKRSLRRKVQGTRTTDKFCCLGVLCDLAVQARVIPKAELDSLDGVYGYGKGEDKNSGVLPQAVAEWAGLNSSSGVYGAGSLTTDNDALDRDFYQIAQIIEERF